ncbi:MAG: hypothetical protein LCH44_04050 [Bacteroidetes bacterium]|nr:hypothetical protein [Bacteroidota bacterium]
MGNFFQISIYPIKSNPIGVASRKSILHLTNAEFGLNLFQYIEKKLLSNINSFFSIWWKD